MLNEKEIDKTSQEYQDDFLKLRAKYDKKIFKKGSLEAEDILAEAYIDVCADAAGGDVVSQDLLSYWFKRGNLALPENIELSMKWQFLAGANGNKFSIDKFQLFFSYSYDTIIFSDLLKDVQAIFDINAKNYQYLFGELFCKEIVKDLGIDALSLSKEKLTKIEFNTESMQKFTASLNRAVPKVVDYLTNLVQKYKK